MNDNLAILNLVMPRVLRHACCLFLCFLMYACGDDGSLLGDQSSGAKNKVKPTFLNVSARLNAVAGDSKVTLNELMLRVSRCNNSEEVREERVLPAGNKVTVFNFKSTDENCRFEIVQAKVTENSTISIYKPALSESTDSGVKTYLDSTQSQTSLQFYKDGSPTTSSVLVVDLSTTYTGTFKEHESLIALLSFVPRQRGLGSERSRKDILRPAAEQLTQATPVPVASDTLGVGLRIDSFVGKRPPAGSDVIALEIRFSCLETRQLEMCLNRNMIDFQFRLVKAAGDQITMEEILEATRDSSLLTSIVSNNVFGNGVYAVLALPEKKNADSLKSELYWVIVQSLDRISAFELSTDGLKVF